MLRGAAHRVRYTRWRQQSYKEGSAAEAQLLTLNRYPMTAVDVPVGKEQREDFIHTLVGGDANKPALVMAPGYAAGLGFFFRNFDGLSPHFRLMAFDWLGTGLSGRPPFTATGRQDAEAFFLDSLKEWKHKMGLGKMVLMGHSLGGYLAACYALKHPEDVEHLLLVCPAGVPEAPAGWRDTWLKSASTARRMLARTFMWAWDRGVTPGSFVRGIGPLGPGLIERYVGSRFSHHGQRLDPKEKELFQSYFYQIIAAPGSGEYALQHLLAPGAWAHAPLVNRLHELKVPVTFIYGVDDWMQPGEAQKLCQQLKSERQPLMNSDLKVEIVDDAGHFVFLEQPELFNRAVVDACAAYLGPAAEQRAAAAMPHAHEERRSADATEWKYAPDAKAAPEEVHAEVNAQARQAATGNS